MIKTVKSESAILAHAERTTSYTFRWREDSDAVVIEVRDSGAKRRAPLNLEVPRDEARDLWRILRGRGYEKF